MKTQQNPLLTALQAGALDNWPDTLEGAASAARRERCAALLAAFDARFPGGEPRLFSAPGRTELAGNHTDHQHGRVLCASLSLDTLCAAAPNSSSTVRLVSEGYGECAVTLDTLAPRESERESAAALIRGVAAGLAERGFPVAGFDAFVTSHVPAGGGFSSSASFEVLLGAVFSTFFAPEAFSPVLLAQIGQAAENRYFGKPCGLMDQCACALGGVVMLDFADPAQPQVEQLPFSFRGHGYVLAAVKVGSSHADLTADYAAIPGEMRLAAQALGQEVLGSVSYRDYLAAEPRLAKTLPPRALSRAHHFFEENERVPQMAQALRENDVERYRQLMRASGDSSRRQLQNIIPDHAPAERRAEQALALCETLLGERGAWRIHGGGFGGSIQALMPQELWPAFQAKMNEIYGENAAMELRLRDTGVAVSPQRFHKER